MPQGLQDLSSSNPRPLQWKHKAFTTGTPGKSLDILKQLSAVGWMTSPLPKDHIRRKGFCRCTLGKDLEVRSDWIRVGPKPCESQWEKSRERHTQKVMWRWTRMQTLERWGYHWVHNITMELNCRTPSWCHRIFWCRGKAMYLVTESEVSGVSSRGDSQGINT